MALNPQWDNVQKMIEAFSDIFQPETSLGYLHLVFDDYNLDEDTIKKTIHTLNPSDREQTGREHCIEFFLRLLLDMDTNGIDIAPGEED